MEIGGPRRLVAELVVDLLVEDEHGAAVKIEYPDEVGASRVVFDETRHAATPLVPPTKMQTVYDTENKLKKWNTSFLLRCKKHPPFMFERIKCIA